jgi:glycosyltransferase involved in cell wall biosynthesis
VKLSILIPAYNEEETIRQSIQAVLDTDFSPLELEIIVVDDASTDRTRSIVEGFGEAVRLVPHERNQGKGAAIRTALEKATGEIAAIHDADLEYDPRDLPALVRPIAAGESVAAFGSRFLANAHPDGMHTANLIANRILTIAANILFAGRITDEATCYKAVKTDVLRGLDLRCHRFEFCPEVTAKLMRRGHKIVDVPVRYHARTVAEGKKIHWYDGLEAIWTLVKYRFV